MHPVKVSPVEENHYLQKGFYGHFGGSSSLFKVIFNLLMKEKMEIWNIIQVSNWQIQITTCLIQFWQTPNKIIFMKVGFEEQLFL